DSEIGESGASLSLHSLQLNSGRDVRLREQGKPFHSPHSSQSHPFQQETRKKPSSPLFPLFCFASIRKPIKQGACLFIFIFLLLLFNFKGKKTFLFPRFLNMTACHYQTQITFRFLNNGSSGF
ncbi:hypothetical protein S83_026107, partial [Arachis hypogaea]